MCIWVVRPKGFANTVKSPKSGCQTAAEVTYLVTLKTEYCWVRFAGYFEIICLTDRIPFIAVLLDKRTTVTFIR